MVDEMNGENVNAESHLSSKTNQYQLRPPFTMAHPSLLENKGRVPNEIGLLSLVAMTVNVSSLPLSRLSKYHCCEL